MIFFFIFYFRDSLVIMILFYSLVFLSPFRGGDIEKEDEPERCM